MSYEPTLIINFQQLKARENALVEMSYCGNDDSERVARDLLEVLKGQSVSPRVLNGTEYVYSAPELTSFNKLVRDQLTEWEIEYAEFW